MSKYTEMAKRHQDEVNAFPFIFAFTDKQLDEGMVKLGLRPCDTDKICNFGDTGGFYRRSDALALHEMFAKHHTEMVDAIAEDKTGDGFIFDMFNYELANHEYTFTGNISDTVDALGLTIDEVYTNPVLYRGLEKACKAQRDALCR